MKLREYAKKLTDFPEAVQEMDMSDIEIILVDQDNNLLLIPKTKKR